MKNAFIIILLYIAAQFMGTLAALPFALVWEFATTGTVSNAAVEMCVVPSMYLSALFLVLLLWKLGFLSGDRRLWQPGPASYLGWTVLLSAAAIVLCDFLISVFDFLPNWLEGDLDDLMSSWAGIVEIALIAPVVEEICFRGAITRALLQKYKPGWAIVFSALIFGIIHFNPVQTVNAFFAGLLLGWLYYRTRSIVPGIVLHVLNNSVSVWLTLNYPDAMSISDVMDVPAYCVTLVLAGLALLLAFWRMERYPVAPPPCPPAAPASPLPPPPEGGGDQARNMPDNATNNITNNITNRMP